MHMYCADDRRMLNWIFYKKKERTLIKEHTYSCVNFTKCLCTIHSYVVLFSFIQNNLIVHSYIRNFIYVLRLIKCFQFVAAEFLTTIFNIFKHFDMFYFIFHTYSSSKFLILFQSLNWILPRAFIFFYS